MAPATPGTSTPVTLRIEGTGLPGRACAAAPGFPGYTDIHVAVQRRAKPGELLDPTPGDADRAVWTLECVARTVADGTELTGPYVQGGPGGRFVYLSWGGVGADGSFAVFRRAKLLLEAVEPDVLAAAVRSGRLTGRLGLTDPEGHPLCARVVPPVIAWSAA
ncbi:DUF5990 family protein [Streptomyces sp. NPDC008079]|uniref:DUF5990 family protein n=1 Tax=Streptomyces sp. NPDC008079 TaxID=3364806 RepID=UPI0036EA5DFD